MPVIFTDFDAAATRIIETVGKKIILGLPLGIGKPIGFVNALYNMAVRDSSIELVILTGLTLARPTMRSDLEKNFLEPILKRILGNYEDPLYEKARVTQTLPNNIRIIEFFLSPGKFLKNHSVQQNYLSADYNCVVRDALGHSINVITQQVCRSEHNPDLFSLSSNPDLFGDMTRNFTKNDIENHKIAIVAEINQNLPFMPGEAVVQSDQFTHIIDSKQYPALFAFPKSQLSIENHITSLYASALIKDGGCLQIGIGKPGDAISHALILRHRENGVYREMLHALKAHEKFGDVLSKDGDLNPFEQGLYAATEMFSDGYMHLMSEKILKKRAFDHPGLQILSNLQLISDKITADFFDTLAEYNLIQPEITHQDFLFLQKYDIIRAEVIWKQGSLMLPTGEIVEAILSSDRFRKAVPEKLAGRFPACGKIIHAGFFIGTNEFYHFLKNAPAELLQQIEMCAIAKTNSLCWSHELATLQRPKARFVNAAMMATLTGSIISDGLPDWREVSGVGGQADFAHMAQQLPTARFIINCPATRKHHGKTDSNIVWEHPNITLPRYMRDIVITEYGIADCRGKTDAETIMAMLNIADSRFQQGLLIKAKKFGKLPENYDIPKIFKNNYPEELHRIARQFRVQGYFRAWPFGTELTDDEQVLRRALLFLKNCHGLQLVLLMMKSLLPRTKPPEINRYLTRAGCNHPRNLRGMILKKLLAYVIIHYVIPQAQG